MSNFHPGQIVRLATDFKRAGVTIPSGTEVEVVCLIMGEFDKYCCDLDGWVRLDVYGHDLEPVDEQKQIDELVKPLDCPVETPEEREWFDRIESKIDSLSRRVDLLQSTACGIQHNKSYEG